MDLSTVSFTGSKRPPQRTTPQSHKRVKASSRAPMDENIHTTCSHATVATTIWEGLSPDKLTEKDYEELSLETEDEEDAVGSHSSASRPSGEPNTLPPVHDLSESDARAAHRDIEEKLSQNDGDGMPASESGRSYGYSDAYCTPDYSDDLSQPRSPKWFVDLDEEMGRWTPPLEPLRPTNPYKEGQLIEIRKHVACPPFGADYPYHEGDREPAPERELRSKTLVELCLDRPTSAGEAATDQEPRTLEIVKEIRSGDESGAQIVVCQFIGTQEEMVAKIYDPLYYGFANRMWSDRPRDVTYEADNDYSREVAAYSELNSKLGGKEIPQYYGSWTFRLPLNIPGKEMIMRDVQLVLIEYIKGTPMTDLNPESVPEAVGMEIVALLVETRSKILFAGVNHGDVSQRNIMVCLTEPNIVERVAFIDFNFAVVTRLDNFEQAFPDLPRRPKPEKLPSPIDAWWGGALYGVAGEWFPKSWEMRLRACQEWLYERYANSEEYEAPHRRLTWDEENLPRMWIAT